MYRDRARPVPEELLKRMNAAQGHRGPDDSGTWAKANIGFGHVRLSIIDLSVSGHQPMSNEDGTIWISFNGEIYNFQELRDLLIARGHHFRSHSDTEVIIHLWEDEGERCVEKLAGMFALAIWDDRRQALFLARDRVGKKPLFYSSKPDRFVFGSEIKAILQDPDFRAEPDLEAMHHYLAYQSVPAPFSAFKGIRKIPPGCFLLLENGKETLRRYWRLSYRHKINCETKPSRVALQAEIIDRLREAVRGRLMSDVPLGAFLSGGIDSSIVVALMAGLLDQPVKTFSIGFREDEYNELPFARMVAERYGTDHHEFLVTPDAKSIFPELVWHYNEPFADPSAIPTYYVSQLARKFVTVALTGDGGDENFAGYQRYRTRGRSLSDGGPVHSARSMLTHVKSLGHFVRPEEGWRNFGRLRHLDQRRMLYYFSITHFHEGYQSQLYRPEFRRILGNSMTVDLMLGKYRQSDGADFLDSTLDVELGLYLPDTLMTKTDVASMSHSLEVRSPFLDHRFLEFSATIPSTLKLWEGVEGKYVLKKAVEPYLPDEVICRPKMGFGVPIDHWFRDELREMVRDILLSRRAIDRSYFRPEYIARIIDRHQSGAENWQYLIWNLLMLEFWHLMFIDRVMSVPTDAAGVWS